MPSIYVIDTNSLIDLNQYYPQDTFSGLWDKFQLLVDNDRLIAPKEVLKEIPPGKVSELYKWCKNNKKMFIENNKEILIYVAEIMRKHKGLVPINKQGPVADPFIIALACSRKNNLTNSEIIVVTQEGVGSKHKIPFVSRDFNITCIKLMELIRQENWKF